ncbi:tRNA (cytidine(34)-2'-O)-methyltransferase [Pararhizobium sp. IMCC21322]|uniref:tRNA (cytidine(34)-2'-O)-methyltransferase n=1 Tax=Pararhizobium sp. IMCC21322 TaxID=3067903 RepID=UPI002740ED5C|nr:tRNA (cytidine(34)-2'-O)-methyltransferase [Pararhizobium sp. IMCC21322]
MALSLALYQPDIPQNTATLLRTGACLNVPVHIILPAGFVLSDRNFRRAGMDYLEKAVLVQHADWAAFQAFCRDEKRRIVLLSTKAAEIYTDFRYQENDVLMLGRESAGVPDHVHEAADARILIPMHGDARSLNVAISGAMVLGEALRQMAL